MWPAIAHSGALDQTSSHHDGGGEEAGEIDNRGGAFGTPAQLAIGVHPGLGTLQHPPLANLQRSRLAALGDLAGTPSVSSNARVAGLS